PRPGEERRPVVPDARPRPTMPCRARRMSTRPRTVLVVHPGAELLRSDRVLLESVTGLREARCRVVVALPAEGPLVAQLRRTGAEVQIVPMLVARRALLRPGAWWLLLRGAT